MVIHLGFQSPERNGEDGLSILELLTIRLSYLLHLRDQLPIALERPMPGMIFKENLKRFSGNSFCWLHVYIFSSVFTFYISYTSLHGLHLVIHLWT